MAKWKTWGLRSWLLGVAAVVAMGAGVVGAQFRRVDIVVQGPTGKRDVSLWTFRSKVRSVLQQAGIGTNVHDKVFPASGTLTASNQVQLDEAIPVWVQTAHHRKEVWTTRYRVQAILEAAKIRLNPLDEVRPQLATKLTGSYTINVIRRWMVTKQVTQTIPFAVQHKPDPTIDKGHSVIVAKGEYGKLVKTLRQLVQNGTVMRTTLVKTTVAVPARAEVIGYGTKQPSRGGTVPQFSRRLAMLSTGYWPDPAWSSGYTALGMKAQYGVVAVDPAVIALGTRLFIPGYGFAIAADTGSAIVGDRIDLCFNTAQQAVDWGARPITVYILGS